MSPEPLGVNAWDLLVSRLDRLEDKIDRVGERVVPRDEFDRYKSEQARALASLRSEIRDHADTLDAYRTREQDDKNRSRMWAAGMVLAPVISAAVSFIVTAMSRGGA